MTVDERLLRRAFCEPLPEPKKLPPVFPAIFGSEHYTPNLPPWSLTHMRRVVAALARMISS